MGLRGFNCFFWIKIGTKLKRENMKKSLYEKVLDFIKSEFDFDYLDDPEIRNLIIFLICVCLSIVISEWFRDLGGAYPIKEIMPNYGTI